MKKIYKLLILCCVCGTLVLSLQAQEKQLAPLAVEDAISSRAFNIMPISLSYDGQWVAYSLIDPLRAQVTDGEAHSWFIRSGAPHSAVGSDVWVTSTETGEATNLTEGKGNNWAPVWSPDGKYLAFFSDRSGKANLWVWEQSSRRSRQLSNAIVTSFRGIATPRWTADSRKILLPVLPQETAIEKSPGPTGDSEKDMQTRGPDEKNKPTVTVYRSSVASKQTATQDRFLSNSLSSEINAYSADLALIDVVGSSVERIVLQAKPVGYWISPNGLNIAFTNVKDGGTGMVSGLSYDLTVISSPEIHVRVVASNIKQGGRAVSWSPDGKMLSYFDSKPSPNANIRADVYLVTMGEGEPRRAANTSHPSFTQSSQPPLWDKTGKFLYLLASHALWKVSTADGTASEAGRIPDRNFTEIVASNEGRYVLTPDGGHSIILVTSDPESMRVGFSAIDVTTGRVTRLIEENKTYTSSISYTAVGSSDGNKIFYIAESAAESPDIWMADSAFHDPRRLTRINQQFDKYLMGKSQLIEWRSLDGQTMRGALLLPAGYKEGKRYPLVVEIYSGYPLSQQANTFGMTGGSVLESIDNKQLLTTRGYAVLLADTDTNVGTIAQDLVKTLLPGVNKAVDMGIADPNRLGITGFSQGGYGTLAVITQTPLFKAAVMRSGFGNLMSMYGLMNKDGSSQWTVWAEVYGAKMGGTPWEYPTRYIENSPVFYLDRVQTPVLIVHGNADEATPAAYADEVFVDLRRLGKEVEYAKYEGESHGFDHYANKLDYCNRMIRWFDSHLKASSGEMKSQ